MTIKINQIQAVILLIGSILVMAWGCADSGRRDDIRLSLFTSGNKDTYVFGDEVVITAEFHDTSVDDATVEFYVDNMLAFTDDSFPFEYRLSNLFYRAGVIDIDVILERNNRVVDEKGITLTIESETTPLYGLEIINEYDHDETAFTQGLVFEDGFLYESTGLWGASTLRKVIPETGAVVKSRAIDGQYFAEGVTIWNDEIIQLTWMSKKGFVYDMDTFDLTEEFSFAPAEGWGLTHDTNSLIMSDGTSKLYYLDPLSKEVVGELSVSDSGEAITRINEMEYIHGDIFANIWMSSDIARISTRDGSVTGWIDCSEISKGQLNGVLNGIAYDEENGRLFLTGKRWTSLYEVNIVPQKKVVAQRSDSPNF